MSLRPWWYSCSASSAFRRACPAADCWPSLQERIHLGLDLKGGTHLILQVQVNDAVNGDSDRALERLKEDLRTHKINYTEISKPDPVNHPDQIVLKGVPPEATSDLRSIVSERLPEYDLNSGAENTWTFTMKPQALAELKNRAVQSGHRNHPQPY